MTIHTADPSVPQPPPLLDVAEIQRALTVLMPPGQVVELRILNARMASSSRYAYQASGYFDKPGRLIQVLAALRGAKGVYLTLHPCQSELLARATNRLRTADEMRKAPATNDQHITVLRWLPVDIDPERPADISSTEEEHQAALAQAQVIKTMLQTLGWPAPLEADSGNGAHLLYPVDLPVEEGKKETGLLHRVLKGLAAQFDLVQERASGGSLQLRVDQSVFNPSRIWKLYGTLACKGDHTLERPHRMARVLVMPALLEPVSRELLEAIAVPLPTTASGSTMRTHRPAQGNPVTEPFNLEEWIVEHQLSVIGPTNWQGGRKWVFRICPWNEEHTDRSAFIIQHANGSIGAGCHHHSCQSNNWQALRELYDPTRDRKQDNAQTPGLHLVKSSQETQEHDLSGLEEALATHNVAHLLDAIPTLALLTRLAYMQQKQRIKEAFGVTTQ